MGEHVLWIMVLQLHTYDKQFLVLLLRARDFYMRLLAEFCKRSKFNMAKLILNNIHSTAIAIFKSFKLFGKRPVND